MPEKVNMRRLMKSKKKEEKKIQSLVKKKGLF